MSGCEFEFCEACNSPLTLCGQPNPDGEPSLDCHVCLLREKIAEKDKQIAEHEAFIGKMKRFNAAVNSVLGKEVKMIKLLDRVPHDNPSLPHDQGCSSQCLHCAWEKLKAT